MNIGYEIDGHGSGILNKIPMVWTFKTPKEFTDFIRRCSIDLVDWAVQNSIPKGCLMLHVSINLYYKEDDQDWIWNNEFNIHCKNIREYQPYLKMTNDEIAALVEATKRDRAISDVLD